MDKLELVYRVIDVAAGDLGTSAQRKFDCEAWIASQGRYRELTSTSNCTDFQTRRLDTRGRAPDGTVGPVATLNGTLCSTNRRYLGVTTSHGRRHARLAEIMENQPLDFVQFTYNIEDREAEERLLPLAVERGLAVIINRPFKRGALIDRLKGKPLPDFAGEVGCRTWPQFLLKFIVSYPAVTCAIPATSVPAHMRENMVAGRGLMPDVDMRRRMAEHVQNI
jgi:aryl-alcohol dehydrogenase-like predicted oxidoreductase